MKTAISKKQFDLRVNQEAKELEAVFNLIRIISEALKEAGQIPSGTLYAILMEYGISLDQYQRIIESMKSSGRIKEENNLLIYIPVEEDYNEETGNEITIDTSRIDEAIKKEAEWLEKMQNFRMERTGILFRVDVQDGFKAILKAFSGRNLSIGNMYSSSGTNKGYEKDNSMLATGTFYIYKPYRNINMLTTRINEAFDKFLPESLIWAEVKHWEIKLQEDGSLKVTFQIYVK